MPPFCHDPLRLSRLFSALQRYPLFSAVHSPVSLPCRHRLSPHPRGIHYLPEIHGTSARSLMCPVHSACQCNPASSPCPLSQPLSLYLITRVLPEFRH